MFSIIKKLIPSAADSTGKTSASSRPAATGDIRSDSKGPVSLRTHSTAPGTLIHRNLCAVVLRDTLRMYGIPREWISIDVKNLSRHASIVHLQISLVIRHWHDGLLKYAPVLQKQFLQSLQSFDPDTDYSRQVVFWRFSATCNCPYTEVPGPGYWEMPGLSDGLSHDAKTALRSDWPPLNQEQHRQQNGDFPPARPRGV